MEKEKFVIFQKGISKLFVDSQSKKRKASSLENHGIVVR
jgi:hypothetical protein